jgi:hypothetical protein
LCNTHPGKTHPGNINQGNTHQGNTQLGNTQLGNTHPGNIHPENIHPGNIHPENTHLENTHQVKTSSKPENIYQSQSILQRILIKSKHHPIQRIFIKVRASSREYSSSQNIIQSREYLSKSEHHPENTHQSQSIIRGILIKSKHHSENTWNDSNRCLIEKILTIHLCFANEYQFNITRSKVSVHKEYHSWHTQTM